MLFNRKESGTRISLGKKPLFEVTRFVQEIITDVSAFGTERAKCHQDILEGAQAGSREMAVKATELVQEILREFGLEVEGMSREEASHRIYSYAWGLDVLEDIYRDPTVDEIRVNGPAAVYIQRRGKNEKAGARLKDEEHVRKIISRLFIHDRGIALTASTPVVESTRLDGTRVTATCPPATRTWTLVLRKHGTFKMSVENLITAGTLNKPLLELLDLLIRGRANILFSGSTGSGKTSLVRFMANSIHPSLRIVTLETDIELRLADQYPHRDIVEMEEHADLGLTMNRLFRTILRYSPDVIIVGEIRGRGEAVEAVKACTRGHQGSMATVHFNSPEEAISGCAKMMLEEGLNLPLDIAATWVADAFNVVVQLFADTKKGYKKVIRVTEVWAEKQEVKFRDLAVWQPTPEDYSKGRWVFPNLPSRKLQERMFQYGILPEELERLSLLADKVVCLA